MTQRSDILRVNFRLRRSAHPQLYDVLAAADVDRTTALLLLAHDGLVWRNSGGSLALRMSDSAGLGATTSARLTDERGSRGGIDPDLLLGAEKMFGEPGDTED